MSCASTRATFGSFLLPASDMRRSSFLLHQNPPQVPYAPFSSFNWYADVFHHVPAMCDSLVCMQAHPSFPRKGRVAEDFRPRHLVLSCRLSPTKPSHESFSISPSHVQGGRVALTNKSSSRRDLDQHLRSAMRNHDEWVAQERRAMAQPLPRSVFPSPC